MDKFTNINNKYLLWDISAIHMMTTQEMINDETLFVGNIIKTQGFSTEEDNGGGLFIIQKEKPNTPSIQLTNNLYAKMLPQPFYDLKAFGLVERSDITDKFNKLITWCSSNNIKVGITNDYMVDLTKGLLIPSNTHLIGDKTHKLYGKTPYNLTHYNVLKISNAQNVVIDGLNIDGVKDGNESTEGEWGHCIMITQSSSNILIKNCHLYNAFGDGIEMGGISHHISVKDCHIENCRRQGISILSNYDVLIENLKINNISGTFPQHAIDIEPFENTAYIDNIIIRNLECTQLAGCMIEVNLNTGINTRGNVLIENCIVTNSQSGLVFRNIGNGMNIKCNNIHQDNVYSYSIFIDRSVGELIFDNIYLIDCGYKYMDGTSAVGRMVHLNSPVNKVMINNIKTIYKTGKRPTFDMVISPNNETYDIKDINIIGDIYNVSGLWTLDNSMIKNGQTNTNSVDTQKISTTQASNVLILNSATVHLSPPNYQYTTKIGQKIIIVFNGTSLNLTGTYASEKTVSKGVYILQLINGLWHLY